MPTRSNFHRLPPGRVNARVVAPTRAGFTLPEILIVIVMISVLALVAIPRFANVNAKRHLESARMRVAAGLVTARQAAIQKGQPVQFMIRAKRVTVTTVADTTKQLMSPVPLDTLYKVSSVTGVADPFVVIYGARGFATSPVAKKTIMLTRSGAPDDSVVVTKFGMVQR